MHKSNRLFLGGTTRQIKWLSLCTAMILLITTLSLPLFAANPRGGRDGRGMMGDIRDGVRQFGRDVSDMVDPDGDGILPDGSIDNGIQNDGNQNGTDNTPNTPSNPADTPDGNNGVLPGTTPDTGDNTPGTSEDQNDPTPGTDDADRTDEATPGTTAPTTTTDNAGNNNDTTDNTNNAEDDGFRWTGIVIALVVIAAVVGIIILLIPKKKS